MVDGDAEAEVVDRLAVVNAAHPVAYDRALRTAAQLRRSWYVLAFQVPRLPEWLMGRNDCARLRELFASVGVAPEVAQTCVAALEDPDARRPPSTTTGLPSGMASLAGCLPPRSRATDARRLGRSRPVPRALLSQPPREWVPAPVVKHLPEANHWAPVDAPDDVARALIDHFAG